MQENILSCSMCPLTCMRSSTQHTGLRFWRALQVREAVFCCDYQKLFSLYEAAPNMGRALMDISYDKFRHAALTMAVRVYKPHVQVIISAHSVSSASSHFRMPKSGHFLALLLEQPSMLLAQNQGCSSSEGRAFYCIL